MFCRGCGKEIHETAIQCPNCGARQVLIDYNCERYHWSSIVSLISGFLFFLVSFIDSDVEWDKDTAVGMLLFTSVPIVFAIISFNKKEYCGKWMGVTGLVLGLFCALVALGSL